MATGGRRKGCCTGFDQYPEIPGKFADLGRYLPAASLAGALPDHLFAAFLPVAQIAPAPEKQTSCQKA